MNITANEIESVEEAGILNKEPVKLIRTKGGFWIAVGKPRGKNKEEALAAGSHPAIVKFNLEKQYADYEPALMKSEAGSENLIVEKHSHFLGEDLRKSGHDIYSIQNGKDVDFHITKHNVQICSVKTSFQDDSLVVNEMKMDKAFARAMAGGIAEKALSCKASKIRIGVK